MTEPVQKTKAWWPRRSSSPRSTSKLSRRRGVWRDNENFTTVLAPNAAHVLLDGPLADLDPELEELAADALGLFFLGST